MKFLNTEKGFFETMMQGEKDYYINHDQYLILDASKFWLAESEKEDKLLQLYGEWYTNVTGTILNEDNLLAREELVEYVIMEVKQHYSRLTESYSDLKKIASDLRILECIARGYRIKWMNKED
ncbi:hypothetical protein J6S88_01005 [bacterium]|nr:hypothetical protein [bacterium]